MVKVIVCILFGAAFIPGFLSDPFDSKAAYTVDSKSDGRNDLVAYEFYPLKSREKRQTQTVSLSPSSPPSVSTSVANVGTIWMNKTRTAETQGDEKSLLRKSANHFTPNNGSSTPVVKNNATGTDASVPELPEFPQDLEKYALEHNATTKEDNFIYYTVKYVTPNQGGANYWTDMSSNKTIHIMLSNAHRRAATLVPNFAFPFYGHRITNVTIATGGFIYLGDQVHAWLAATQYVAPLMANFDTSHSDNATVSYLNAKDYFTVEWDQVRLHDSQAAGSFTFQVTLHVNGTIVFGYKSIPIPIKSINDTSHPVKVGLSDAYIKDRLTILVSKQKTIYEYHRVDLKNKMDFEITNGSAIIFVPQPTCQNLTTCEECTDPTQTEFECGWCPKLNRCSSGLDRLRQEWTQNDCEAHSVKISTECVANAYNHVSSNTSSPHGENRGHDDQDDTIKDSGHDHQIRPEPSQVTKTKTVPDSGTSAGGVLGIMLLMILVFGATGWVTYAYFYPHSPSGQLLIRYRPSRWGFRRGEARYTAASIHM